MPKKRNSIRNDGRIAVQIYLGTVDGIRKYKTVYGKTQKEADEKAQVIKTKLGKGIDIYSEKDTFEKWSRIWLELKKPEISNGRFQCYKYDIQKFTPLFQTYVSKLVSADFQMIINAYANENPKTGKPSSKKVLLSMKSVVSQVCQLAVDNRVIDYNPAQSIKTVSYTHLLIHRVI